MTDIEDVATRERMLGYLSAPFGLGQRTDPSRHRGSTCRSLELGPPTPPGEMTRTRLYCHPARVIVETRCALPTTIRTSADEGFSPDGSRTLCRFARTLTPKTLILGGVRSGKSRLAERLARDSGLEVVYVATATAGDEEMQARIAAHRARRPVQWGLVEEPIELARVLSDEARDGRLLLIDCLTLWLTNLLGHEDSGRLPRERQALLDCLPSLPGSLILIANETNLGVIPASALARRYCDEAGLLHQALAETCDTLVLTVAGLPQILKGAL